MNAKHISLAFATAVALLAGCAKSPVEEEKPSEQPADLELSSVNAIETKAVIDGTDFPRTGEIGLFLFEDEMAAKAYGTGYENIRYSYNSDKEKWTASPSIKVGSTRGYLYGYYPYKAGTQAQPIDIKAIPIRSSLNGDDVMYATKQTVNVKTASQTSVTMNHALARVSITIVNTGYTGKAELSKIKFSGAGIAPDGTLNALDGKITATQSDVTLDVTGDTPAITPAGITCECLLVPSKVETGKQSVNLALTIDDNDKETQLLNENGIIIAQNTWSSVTIALSNTGITVQTVSVEDWNVVEVGEHKVTVKLDGETDGIERDVWTMAFNDEGSVKIEAFSKSGRSLGCAISGEASCDTVKTDNVYIFTISDISSDVIATVEYQRPTEISLSMSNYTVYSGRSFRLRATVLPDDAYNKSYTWSSDAPSVATVDENGRVTAIAGGTAKITATTVVGGVTSTCTTTVESYESALLKEFSVGPAGNCKKVRFSRGNLNYTPGIDSWWFFDKQYECGHDTTLLSLFTWGYGDWSMSKDTTAYESGNFTDWGTQVGDGNTWRTLTADEWVYLFITRTDAEDKVGYATVCGNKGIIVLPDEFEDPKTNESEDPACVDKKFVPQSDLNVYTSGDSWDKMQAAGALFLPAAGYRDGSTFNSGTGHYWSSSAGVANSIAKYVNFFNTTLMPSVDDSRSKGRSVRLVTEYQSEPSEE